MSYLNEKIKNARNSKRFTQQEVAEYLGISTRMYQRYEKDIEPSIDVLKKLSRFFGIDLLTESPFPADDPANWERAAIKALSWGLASAFAEISELRGKPRPAEDYLEEIDKNTSLILTDLRRSGRKDS